MTYKSLFGVAINFRVACLTSSEIAGDPDYSLRSSDFKSQSGADAVVGDVVASADQMAVIVDETGKALIETVRGTK